MPSPQERETTWINESAHQIAKFDGQISDAYVWLDELLEKGWKVSVIEKEQALGVWKRSMPTTLENAYFEDFPFILDGQRRKTRTWYIGNNRFITDPDETTEFMFRRLALWG